MKNTAFEKIKNKLIDIFLNGFSLEERDYIDISGLSESKSVNDLVSSLDNFGFTQTEAFGLIFNSCEELIKEKSLN